MQKWKLPPRIKIYEALGAIADNRIEVSKNKAIVVSSSGNKQYTVQYVPTEQAITANDNGSYWQGYLGYPSIAFLLKKGIIKYHKSIADLLKGITWKRINQKYKNDFEKVENQIKKLMKERDVTRLDQEVNRIMENINKLNLNKLASQDKPPEGY